MSANTDLVSFDNWTFRVKPGTGKKILLLLHGWTGDENSMSIFIPGLPTNYWIVSPRAPHTTSPKGFSWRAPAPRGTWPSVELFKPSISSLLDLINSWGQSNDLIHDKFDVVGFSQGGALAFTMGLLYPEKIEKIGILSGFAPMGASEFAKHNLLLKGKKIFIAHGTLDDIVPIDMARQMIDLCEESGGNVIFCESEVGHKLSSDCYAALRKYLAD